MRVFAPGSRWCAGFVGVAGMLVACSDPPLCPSEMVVVIQQPTGVISVDADAQTPGIQTPVVVRTTYPAGVMVQLDVLDGAGHNVGTQSAVTDDSGTATLAAVTIPSPAATLQASAQNICGSATDHVVLDVTANSGCDLMLTPAPLANVFYAPLGVLSGANDPDPATPGFQATLSVSTHPSWTVELLASDGQGEHSLGSFVSDANGSVAIAEALADGQLSLRATCTGFDGAASSPSTTVVVDTTAPTCAFTTPAPGATITPAADLDGDLGNGVQLAVAAHVDGDDVDGELVAMTITPSGGTPQIVALPALDGSGDTSAVATLAPATTPATFSFALTVQDHAGNTCSVATPYDVVYNGCSIALVSPTAPVTSDADLDPSDGSQIDVTLAVDPACAGQPVTSICGTDSPSGVVAADGSVSLRVTACSTSPCQVSDACVFRVTNSTGVQTTTTATLAFDDLAPTVSVAIVDPAVGCNTTITAAADADPTSDGVQIIARVAAVGAASQSLQVTAPSGSSTVDATTDVTVTLEGGTTTLVGQATDSLGNVGSSAPCAITLDDLTVSFAPPAADGVVNRGDGTVTGSALTFPLCGAVSVAGASVQLVIDGSPAVAATVTGTTWCRTVSLAESPPSHTIAATAVHGTSTGHSVLVLAVDLTPPGAVTDLTAVTPDRQHIDLRWTAPDDGGHAVDHFVLKRSTVPLTDANFDTTGVALAAPAPGPSGTVETVTEFPARTGLPVWFGVASFDAAGNRSVADIVGPITPTFDQTGAITSPNASQGTIELGFALAHGKLNDDAFDDVVVSAPTQNVGGLVQAGAVYVYFGGPNGIAATPSIEIDGTATNQHFGSALTTLRWTSATRDDLAIGADGADTGAGSVFVFDGGSGFPAANTVATAANLRISVDPTTPGVFATGRLGHQLATADFDGDGVVDLVVSAPKAANGSGVVAIIYGGTPQGNVVLSDTSSAGIDGAVVELFEDPLAASRALGTFVHAVGPTLGPADVTDDIVVAYADDTTTAGDSLYVLRGSGARPTTPGVSLRPFTANLDVRIDLVTTTAATQWGSQATSIGDQDGDGHRDLVLGAYLNRNGAGQVVIIDGAVVGTNGIATTADPGVVRTTINGALHFGAAITERDRASIADVDGDGLEDLLVAGLTSAGTPTMFVWFGGAIPTGTIASTTAPYQITGPSTFHFSRELASGLAGEARWVGDVNGDGLDDVCWASFFDNKGDGSFEVLFDAP